jgi:dihydropyrimidinase
MTEVAATLRCDAVVRGGTIVTDRRSEPADLLIRDGRIGDVVAPGTPVEAGETIDAEGLLVLPGLVDPHCHFDTFSHHVDDLASLSAAAAAGGVTTIVPFLIPGGRPGQPGTLAEILDHFVEAGEERSLVDFGFHVALWPRWEALDEIDACAARGCSSFKMFLALPRLGRMVPDDLVFAFMERIGSCGGLSMVHAENGPVTDYLESKMRARGDTAPALYARSRPPILEEEATFRSICLARLAGAPLYVVHVSAAGAARRIAEARADGVPVVGETCPQYLTLDDGVMRTLGPLAKVAPPLRTPADREQLWRALAAGDLATIGSDHSGHARATKERGRDDVFGDVPFGAATIETMLPLLLSFGLADGRLAPERLAALTSANAARIFGLYPRKGAIEPGSDADLVLVDRDGESTVDAGLHHDRSGYSLYDGWQLRGAVRTVIARGAVIARDGEVVGQEGRGRYLLRPASGLPEGLH